MYPLVDTKMSALPRAELPMTGTGGASHDGYSLHWAAGRTDRHVRAAELELLAQRSSLDLLEQSSSCHNVSMRPDWRATVSRPKGWAETLLLLRQDGALKAAVYLREKKVLGLRTGYFQGASTLGETLILCEAGSEAFYLGLTTELLLNHNRGFLLLLQRPSEDTPALDLPAALQQRSTTSLLHWELPLKFTLEATIQDFSHRTRRNIRSSLRRVDAAGWEFRPHLDFETMKHAIHQLAGRCTHPFSVEEAEQRVEVARHTPDCFSMGLTDKDGQWLCCLVGRRTAQATEIFWQLNAAGSRKISLCIAMRALMTREEVRRRAPLVRYIGGTCALSLPTEARYTAIARPGIRLRLLKLLLRLGLPLGRVLREVL